MCKVKSIRLHLTNVSGAGATQLLLSLLPTLESATEFSIKTIELPSRGLLKDYLPISIDTKTFIYYRYLPNAISRFLECTILSSRFDGNTPLLVLGDIPLRTTSRQTVFVQTAHLLKKPERFSFNLNWIKYWYMRKLFRSNIKYVDSFIVQTDLMRNELEKSYKEVAGRVHVIGQPVPSWLLDSGIHRKARINSSNDGLTLIYPAANYPHKNHKLLSGLNIDLEWPVKKLTLTIEPSLNPCPNISWVECVGFLKSQSMITAYNEADAILFLSKEESYGFPLIEAMFVGIPVICPDLPYAHILCGDQAIYFNPECQESLRHALLKLKVKLESGWWPDWTDQLKSVPPDWETVALQMLRVAGE